MKIKTLIEGIKSFLGITGGVKQKQTTFIYCKCGNEMCSDGSFVSDTYDENGSNHVRYKCKKCGEESDYNFDICMLPVNWNKLVNL